MRVRRRQDEFEAAGFMRLEIEVALFADVGFNAADQPKARLIGRVEASDGAMLLFRLGHRHAARDPQAVRMVGDRRIAVPPREAGLGDLLEGRRAVAPFRMHLEIATVVGRTWSRGRRVVEEAQRFGATEKVLAERPPAPDILELAAVRDRLFDRRRASGLEDLEDHARRSRPNAGNLHERPIWADEVRKRFFERQHGRGGSLVAEHAGPRRLHESQAAQQTANYGVGIGGAAGGLDHRLSMSFASRTPRVLWPNTARRRRRAWNRPCGGGSAAR